MFSVRLPFRLSSSGRPVSLLACRSAPRSVFRVSPFLVSESGVLGGTGVEPVGGSGRGSWGGRLLAWSVRVCSLAVVVGLSVPLYQFPGAISDVGRAVSGRPRLLALVIVLVSSCAFLSALVHLIRASPRLLVSCCGEVVGPFPRPVCLVGGGGAAAGDCLLVRFIAAIGRTMSFISSRSASRLFAARSVEAVMSGVPSCLLGGGGRRRCVASRACSGCRAGAVG